MVQLIAAFYQWEERNFVKYHDYLNYGFSLQLKVGVHNGWTYVSEPHVVYLEPEYEGGGSKSGRKSPSPSQGSLKSAG